MAHGPSTQWGKDHAAEYKSRIGIVLFVLYSLIYAVFVILNVLNPKSMDFLVGEQNLAVVYGFGLIGLALVFGVIYNHLCTKAEDAASKEEE